MKKACSFILSAGLALSLCACAGKNSETDAISLNDEKTENVIANEKGGNGTSGQNFSGTSQGGSGSDGASGNQTGGSGSLRFLASDSMAGCYTSEGYYYQTEDSVELSDGSYATHLMYMDFAAGQEVYLCSNAGCSHNTPDCTSVLPYEDFPDSSCLLFTWADSLYILSKEFDNDGSMQVTTVGEDYFSYGGDSQPAVLYRMNLDGTEREKVYTFDASLALEDLVLGDESGIYVVTKKLTAEQDGSATYINSTERKLVYLDPKAKAEREICSLEFSDSISWRLAGCYGNTLVLEGTDYGREVSKEEYFSDDAYKNLHLKSRELFATLSLNETTPTVRYSISNGEENYGLIDGNMLYISDASDSSIKSVDLSTGEEKTICQQDGCFYIIQRIGNKLCCDSSTGDSTLYYIDVDTGEIMHSSLVNKSLGWSLEIRAVLDSAVLVIYDCEAISLGDGAYDITRYQYGLISREDLFAGNDNFRRISMVGKGK